MTTELDTEPELTADERLALAAVYLAATQQTSGE